MTTKVVFSDIAGTIIDGNPWDYVRKHPDYNQQRGQRELLKFLPIYLGRKARIISDAFFRDRWLKTMAASVKGMKRQTLLDVYKDVVNRQMKAHYHQRVVERLQQHKADGATVILISGMFVEFGKVFADAIGADDALGTRLAYAGDIAMGKIAGKTCVADRKLQFMQGYLQVNHPDVTIAQCYGYADSYSDRSLLRAVGYPTATHPDAGLREIAEANQWQIID